jgi:hypothetical protein
LLFQKYQWEGEMRDYFKPHIVRAGVYGGAVGAALSLITLIPVLGGIIGCLLWPIAVLATIAAGVLAVRWGKRKRGTQALQQGAIDGGLAGGVAGLVSGAVSWVVGILNAILSEMIFQANIGERAVGLLAAIVMGFVSIFAWIIVGAILGAIGGLAYVLIQQQRKSA